MMALNETAARICLAVALLSGLRAGVIAADYPDTITHEKPVSYFRFEPNDGNHVRDFLASEPTRRTVTSQGLDVSVAGALQPGQGTGNHFAHFTGSSYVHASADPDVYEFPGALSIEFWIRPTATSGL